MARQLNNIHTGTHTRTHVRARARTQERLHIPSLTNSDIFYTQTDFAYGDSQTDRQVDRYIDRLTYTVLSQYVTLT